MLRATTTWQLGTPDEGPLGREILEVTDGTRIERVFYRPAQRSGD